MSLPNVAKGDPHVQAHNEERQLISKLQDLSDPEFKTGLSATIATEVAVDAASPTGAIPAAVSAGVGAAGRIDFTTKSDGAAPPTLDSGQAADTVFGSTGRKPVISGGRLVPDLTTNPPGAGSYAVYYQTDVGANVKRIGCEWTQPSGADDGNGKVCLAAWGAVYEGTGGVPQSRCHLVIQPGTGTTGFWEYAVFRGDGSPYVAVKSGTFTNPAADGQARWTVDVVFDEPAGVAYLTLPDGSQATISAAEVAAAFAVHSQTPIAFMDLAANVAVIEHFASAGGNAAKYAGFTGVWAETARVTEDRKSVTPLRLAQAVNAVRQPVVTTTRLAPTTQGTSATTTSTANVTGASITGTFGKTGRCLIELDAYYEFTGTDTVFGRMAGATPGSPLEAVAVGTAGYKAHVPHKFEITGGTPGQSKTWTYQHSSITGGLATLKWGGSGTGLVPPIFIKATPL